MISLTLAGCRQHIRQQRKRISELEEQLVQRDWRIDTCVQQERSVFEYLTQTLIAWFAGRPAPSLLPAGP